MKGIDCFVYVCLGYNIVRHDASRTSSECADTILFCINIFYQHICEYNLKNVLFNLVPPVYKKFMCFGLLFTISMYR